jgi:hypothetical protein
MSGGLWDMHGMTWFAWLQETNFEATAPLQKTSVHKQSGLPVDQSPGAAKSWRQKTNQGQARITVAVKGKLRALRAL